MATYREIKGLTVPFLSGDPPTASAATQTGEVWYNSSTGALKAFVANGTWATAAPMNVSVQGNSGAGTQTAGLAFGGQLPPGKQVLSEAYDGTSWSEHGGNMATGRNELGGCGTSVAGLATCGDRPGTNTDVEEWTDVATARSVDVS